MTRAMTAQWEKETHWRRLIDFKGYTNFTLQNQSDVTVKSLGFVWSPLFFSLRAASRLSWVGWFSPALAFRSLYYPCGKMGTTRNLHKVSKRLLRLLLGTTKTTDKCGTQFGSSSFLPSKVANWRPSKSLVSSAEKEKRKCTNIELNLIDCRACAMIFKINFLLL